ncbi:MAG TPA: gluconate 2-dehydrogenase subunit 3 family protein [Steroidobacteraceae bacterium]
MSNPPTANQARRTLLRVAAWLGTSLAIADWEVFAAALQHAPPGPAGNDAPSVLDSVELADLDALTAQIIPTDSTPGAREAGVAHFIDRALASYLAPVATGFVAGLKDLRKAVHGRYPGAGSFAALSPSQQLEYLASIEASPFFATLRYLTVLGMFSDPSYGGNRDGIGWKLLGFENNHAYAPPFGYYDRGYPGFEAGGDTP